MKDSRIRSLLSSGWQDKNLIVRAEWFSRLIKMEPIFIMKPNAIVKRIFIEYNPEIQKGNW
ncbi:MAG: hypothetical protein A2Y66_08630 [Nitrospirae bacterium RBG_13_41_22]|nr:MAG: hypothetical protein A2Y66_08630 [Nitrospirae bacterium RBG_13_41_22]